MADSEKSFRDREAKASSLRDFFSGFIPAYVPADSALSITNFNATITTASAANLSVETLKINYTNSATARIALVKAVRSAVTQALGYVKSNKAWVTQFKAVKMAADKMRGVRPPSTTTPPPPAAPGATPTPAEKPRNKGEQAYVELAAHLEGFVTALTACPGYAPTGTDISISTFSSSLSQFKGLNSFICSLDAQLTTAQEQRRAVYFDGDSCLEQKFKSVKDAVKGQYGQASTNYGAVKSMKW